MEKTLITSRSKDYELIDSGEGEKLERYGQYILRRPDPQAIWPKAKPAGDWEKADGSFVVNSFGKAAWKFRNKIEESWTISLSKLTFKIKPTAFKHTGVFPEQISNWNWLENTISKNKEVTILNLFGYTGGATLASLRAGASVTHVDGSKSAITWANENAELSGLAAMPVRWIVDDARKFLEREIKRGNKYDGIILDPPAFGRGPKKELWKIEDHFLDLLNLCFKVLSDDPLMFLINGYASGYSSIAYENNLLPLKEKFGGTSERGELTIEESESKRLLSCGIFARWQRS